ncbi:MAG: hypothetical protein MI923_20085, partial [Phycisphaerales bacterium]|nr:hypothetical protein [Phycisphaerales bacterium]
RPAEENKRDWWFDENFRQSDDIEGWLRFAVTQDWKIEGIQGLLTCYRVHATGLSANIEKQFASWKMMREKLTAIAPHLLEPHKKTAEAYQWRYLCRRAISLRDRRQAWSACRRFLRASLKPLLEEPVKSGVTIGAALALALLGGAPYGLAERVFLRKSTA